MLRVLGPGLGGLILLALYIYCIFDVIATDEVLIRNLPKTVWVLIVIFVPTIGSLAWLLLGRPPYAGFFPGDTSTRSAGPIRGPEDDTRWTPPPPSPSADDERLRQGEDELRRREEALGDPDEPPPDDDDGSGDGLNFRS